MKQKIIEEHDDNLDELVVRARSDAGLKKLLEGEPEMSSNSHVICSDHHHIKDLEDITAILFQRPVLKLAYGDGTLYGIDIDKWTLMSIFPEKKVLMEKSGEMYDMYYFKGSLYLCISTGIVCLKPGSGHKAVPEVKYGREVTAICLDGRTNRIHYATANGIIFEHPGSRIASQEFNLKINALGSFENNLYAACYDTIYVVDGADLKQIQKRSLPIAGFCSHKGTLLDYGQYGICETFTGNEVYGPALATAMTVVPDDFFKRMKNATKNY